MSKFTVEPENTVLMIDFNTIIRPHHLDIFEVKVSPIPNTQFDLGLILIIPTVQLEKLSACPKGKERVSYLNLPQFVNEIKGYTYLIYDRKRKICQISNPLDLPLVDVLKSIVRNLPQDILILVKISLNDPNLSGSIVKYVEKGFCNPYICKDLPLDSTSSNIYALCLMRKNTFTHDSGSLKEVNYVLNQFSNKQRGNCELVAHLSKNAVGYLRELTHMGATLNSNGQISQKEMAGLLYISSVSNNYVCCLDIDESSFVIGGEEEVKIVKGLYNFHSHPREAYERHNVKTAWPSAQDYIGFITEFISNDTVLHMVICIEGIYIISMTSFWIRHKRKLDRKVATFILENYSECYQFGKTLTAHLRQTNTIQYNGAPLFEIQYLPWHDATSIFRVAYKKSGVNCFTEDETKRKYDILYKKSK